MKDIRIDDDGDFRCWKCGSKKFLEKRTGRAHVVGFATVGIGALATKKKLKCQACGEYNDTGSAKPWTEPSSKRLGEKFGSTPTAPPPAVTVGVPPPPPPPPPPPVAAVPAGWHADPFARFEYRYWDGVTWTDQVSTEGNVSTDPAS